MHDNMTNIGMSSVMALNSNQLTRQAKKMMSYLCTHNRNCWLICFPVVSIHPSIHPSIHFLPFIRGWVAGAAAWAGTPRLPSPRTLPPAPPGGSQGVSSVSRCVSRVNTSNTIVISLKVYQLLLGLGWHVDVVIVIDDINLSTWIICVDASSQTGSGKTRGGWE